MQPISYARHQFPPEIIRHATWLYLRFTLSYRDVEELLAERGLEVSYETIRRWVIKFGPAITRNLRRLRPRPADTWHLDEMVIRIGGMQMYLWRAVDSEGEILNLLLQPRRDKVAVLRLMRKLLKKQGCAPTVLEVCCWVSRIIPTGRFGRIASSSWNSSMQQAKSTDGCHTASPHGFRMCERA
jgi:putative transposase